MKPTIVRNRTIYRATAFVRTKQMCGHLSANLAKKYGKRSVRVTEGDSVKVLRGEFRGVSGKITKVSTEKSGVAIEGIKKEKLKGGNIDIFIHTSNLLVTDLSTEDKWRIHKLEGTQRTASKAKPPVEQKQESVQAAKPEPDTKPVKKESKPSKEPKEKKESKGAKGQKKGDE